MSKFLGVTLILLSLAIAIIPSFTDCQAEGKFMTLASGMKIPMVCHWTAQAEIGVGIPLLAVGVMMIFTKRKSGFFILSIMGLVLGIIAILLPTSLIGVCNTMTANCNTIGRPALISLGSLSIAASSGGLVLARRANI
jgi:hypothetical protein